MGCRSEVKVSLTQGKEAGVSLYGDRQKEPMVYSLGTDSLSDRVSTAMSQLWTLSHVTFTAAQSGG